ncbi:MAG: hypothetical protein A2086_11355 [Spirochaetes bacterium GWD1_27_9]|nr:MAG: hypothetical protein A2Z98_07590 [Spirochaetes bacterium GWB1_27_13]OHD21516.1 MAG: hypothetical protein A2Y34_01570 [Spirochaetes bacterium GWC1_27_15]OHD33050.1 MAG: hypothetical protein A2086_11355 [Spirochaetes bacterium GWD1_27_9]
MIQSVEIKNYRNLDKLKINSFSTVNLITGKNNTGKSSLLEAIAIYVSNGNMRLIYDILKERGEYYRIYENTKDNRIQTYINSLSSLFTDRNFSFDKKNTILINTTENNEEKFISLRFVKYYKEIIQKEDSRIFQTKIIENEEEKEIIDYNIGFEVKIDENSTLIKQLDLYRPYNFDYTNSNFQFIKTKNVDRENNGELWDKIALTDKENFVIEGLKIIEPDIERLTFVSEDRIRKAVIKLKDKKDILPLKSMGDGINRILTIILALVNCENGFLFIDEFENGLHYSVQENLWKVIFSLSKKLNIQIFATTHSNDSIYSFQKVINIEENLANGKLIRLDYKDNQVKEVEFDANELKIATEEGIEIR